MEGSIPAQEIMGIKRETTIHCLEFLQSQVIESRSLVKIRELGEPASIQEILEGLTVDAYSELLNGWHLVPNIFF